MNYLSMQRSMQVWLLYMAETGGRLNKKDGLTRYGDSHVKDKTSVINMEIAIRR